MVSSRKIWLFAVCTAIAATAAGFYFFREQVQPPAAPPSTGSGFRDVAREAGINFRMTFLPNEQGENFKINLYDHGCGVAVADIDSDGFDDLYFTNQLGANALYRNKGDGTFADITQSAGVALGNRICVGATFADYDNDGDPDLYVTSTRGGNVLFKNLGQGKFQDVTQDAGVALIAHCQTAAFFDYDNDGFLDLFVTCSAQWTFEQVDASSHHYLGFANLAELSGAEKEYNVFYRNNGDATFTDVTDKVGLQGHGWGGDVAVFDYDEDGRLDLFVTNMFGASQLYRNGPGDMFQNTTDEVLGKTPWGAIGCKAFDFNNDGKLDLAIADMHSDMWMPFSADRAIVDFVRQNEATRFPYVLGPRRQMDENGEQAESEFAEQFQIRYDKVLFGNALYKNLGRGQFVEVSATAGVETFWPWGIATGDFDNDGLEDMFIPAGMGYPFFYWENRLLMNRGNETFVDHSHAGGIEPPVGGIFLEQKIGGKDAARSSRCAAVADFRGNGRLDIVTNNFNDRPYYFQNEFPQKNYIAFRLQGTKSNRDAIGALVRIYLGNEVMVRQLHCAGGYLSQSTRTLHFGLGDRRKIDRVEVRWPSGIQQTVESPSINKLHRLLEPAG